MCVCLIRLGSFFLCLSASSSRYLCLCVGVEPPRFLSNMPASYFRQTTEESRLQHLGAISSMLEVSIHSRMCKVLVSCCFPVVMVSYYSATRSPSPAYRREAKPRKKTLPLPILIPARKFMFPTGGQVAAEPSARPALSCPALPCLAVSANASAERSA